MGWARPPPTVAAAQDEVTASPETRRKLVLGRIKGSEKKGCKIPFTGRVVDEKAAACLSKARGR